jgi:hypothetical protein
LAIYIPYFLYQKHPKKTLGTTLEIIKIALHMEVQTENIPKKKKVHGDKRFLAIKKIQLKEKSVSVIQSNLVEKHACC